MQKILFAPLFIFAIVAVSGCTQKSKALKNIYGQIETDEIDVASRVPARVKKILVKAGQKVKAGETLVVFEDDVISAKRRQAEAMVAAAKSKQGIANDAVRPEEKEQLKAGVEAARKQMQFAKSSLERAKNAFKEGAIAQQNLDEVEFKYQASLENYNALLAKQRMANVGARVEEKAGAEALVHQAENALAEAQSYAKDIELVSPIDGEVFQLLSHEGELVPAGYPVVTLLKLPEVWVTFQIPEDSLKNFPMNQKVKVVIPALGDKALEGNVSYMAPMAGFAVKTTTQDRGTFDLKTFELRVSFPTPPGEDVALRPGMTALVTRGE